MERNDSRKFKGKEEEDQRWKSIEKNHKALDIKGNILIIILINLLLRRAIVKLNFDYDDFISIIILIQPDTYDRIIYLRKLLNPFVRTEIKFQLLLVE